MPLDWDYKLFKVHIAMIKYVAGALIRFQHNATKKPQYQAHPHIKPKYEGKLKYSKFKYSPPSLKDMEKNSSKKSQAPSYTIHRRLIAQG